MSHAIPSPDDGIASYQAGKSDDDELNQLIASTWDQLLKKPEQRRAIAALLGCPPEALQPDQIPFHARVQSSGLTGGEILIAVASGFVLAFAKDVGGQLGKSAAQRLRSLWVDFMQKKVSPPGSGNLGQAKDEDAK